MLFFRGMRTRYGKVTSMKSGQEAPTLSERDEFIVSNFQFLGDHIIRVARGKQSAQVNSECY